MLENTQEKRKFPRLKTKAAMRFEVRGENHFKNALSDDISLGGTSFVNDKFIAPKTTLRMQINLLNHIINPIAKVSWVTPVAHSDRYRMGVEFLELNNPEKNYLNDYICLQTGNL